MIFKIASPMNKWLKYALRTILVLISILLIAMIVVYTYFRTHKGEILANATDAIGSKINGKVEIKDVGINFFKTFPDVSVVLNDISIRGPLYPLHHHDLLKAKEFLLITNPFKMLSGKFEFSKVLIENGSVYLYEDSLGHKSLDAFKKDPAEKKKKSGMKASFETIKLVDMRITIDQPYKKKLYDFNIKSLKTDIGENSGSLTFDIDMDLVVEKLAFNLDKGSFAEKQPLKGKFETRYDTASHTLSFNDITLEFNDEPYQFTGKFKLNEDKPYSLDINVPEANFSKAKALLPISIRKNIDSIEINKPLKVVATLNGSLIPGSKPVVKVTWVAHDTPIKAPFGSLEKTELDGFFYNKVSDTLAPIPENSTIQFNNFSGILEGINIHSKKISITNLKKPVLHCDIESATDLVTLNNSLGSDAIEFNKGTMNVNLLYEGTIYDSATEAPSINGQIQIRNAGMLYGPRQISLDNFSGDLVFKGADVFFNNIKATAQGSSVVLNVSAINLLALMNSDPSKIQLNASIFSPAIDINKFTSFVGKRKKTKARKDARKLYNIATKIDKLLELCSINTHIDAQKITFNNFVASNVKSDITLNNDLWALKNTSLNADGGTIKIDGFIKDGSNNYSPVNVKVIMDNLNVDKAFYSFNNFGMSSLSSKNLKGKLSSNINISAALSGNATLVPSSLKGTVSFSLKNGEINNWEPLEKMSFFLFKNRDFSHVAFSEIKDRIEINGQRMKINLLEIQSTILSLFIEGLYDLSGKNTDLVITVPLSNLKKRKADFKPENNGQKGKSVYITVKNKTNGDIDFGFKLSNKHKK